MTVKIDRWNPSILRKDVTAGMITGLMAIPITVGICLMSEFPVQTGLLTVVCACIISFITSFFRPGNHTGVPGVAAGLAPVLALGIHQFGMVNMPFLIALTALIQMLVWSNGWEKYILKAVPSFLVEGLLAGVGAKIALKFLPYTYETIHASTGKYWLSQERLEVICISLLSMGLFLWLFNTFKKTNPGLPYIITIVVGVLMAAFFPLPMLHIEHLPIHFNWPLPNIDMHHPSVLIHMAGYALMLATIDIIEQVMCNVAIGKMDPLQRPVSSNNSLLAIWISNLLSSLFGGMTNLDGLAKSTTNTTAGAITKTSNLITAGVLLFFVFNHHLLEYLPQFSLAVLMIFAGLKMVAGITHVAAEGKYAFMLSLFCGIFVFEMGIFEGLLLSLAIHVLVTYMMYRHQQTPTMTMLRHLFEKFMDDPIELALDNTAIETDTFTGGKRYRTLRKLPSDRKLFERFIEDWAVALNSHSLLQIVNLYDYDALLWGTFAKELGSGHVPIKKYFEHLLELEDLTVTFQSGETRQYNDVYVQSGSYEFTYIKRGHVIKVPARYTFVCKKYMNSWCIVEHHSSEFPA
ncbi:MAG: SulP family inorganic anion transporter [Vampirovibrio sp.]